MNALYRFGQGTVQAPPPAESSLPDNSAAGRHCDGGALPASQELGALAECDRISVISDEVCLAACSLASHHVFDRSTVGPREDYVWISEGVVDARGDSGLPASRMSSPILARRWFASSATACPNLQD